MKKKLLILLCLLAVGVFTGCGGRSSGSAFIGPTGSGSLAGINEGALGKGDGVEGIINPNRKIIVFKAGTNDNIKEAVSSRHGTIVKHISIINASVVILRTPDEKDALLKDPNVTNIDDDVEVTALIVGSKGTGQKPSQPNQVTPWGISRIGAAQSWGTSTGTNVKIGIIDTGISTSHPDLMIAGGVNAINPQKGYSDDNGHGSHVAGTVAALSNSIGVIGGSYNASLYSIKVLGANGSGYLSDVIEGIQWCVNQGVRLVNLSLGTSTDSSSLREAVKAAYQSGLIMVAAAGNANGGAVIYPAAYPEVIAVSASTQGDNFAAFSSAGPEVDLIAPGSDIFSTYKGTGYATISGTSMAAPHTTAACGLKLALSPGVSPDQMRISLQASADPLPGLNSNQQGAGIVNAQKLLAVQ